MYGGFRVMRHPPFLCPAIGGTPGRATAATIKIIFQFQSHILSLREKPR
jgi:hypothetical protein